MLWRGGARLRPLAHPQSKKPWIHFRSLASEVPVAIAESHDSQQQHHAVREATPKTYHKRVLPSKLTAMSSTLGKQLFREALAQHTMESFFPLSEQFVTQSEPSFCALSSLAMVLNALNHDPGKVWKGSWRWISEETLQCETKAICGHSLD